MALVWIHWPLHPFRFRMSLAHATYGGLLLCGKSWNYKDDAVQVSPRVRMKCKRCLKHLKAHRR